MSQITLDKSLLPEKKKSLPSINDTNGAIPVTPSKNGNGSDGKSKSVETEGLCKMYVDVHEPDEIVEMLRSAKGIYVERKALKSGDYAWSNIGIERKTLNDFYNSIVHGDRHIWKQIFNLKHVFDRPMLVIERWDDAFFSNRQMEKTVRGAIASIFLMGVSVLAIPGKGQNIQPFVDQIAYLFFSSDKKGLSMRPVHEKTKSEKKRDVLSDVLAMVPMIGRAQANQLADHVNSVEELCNMSDEDLKKICPHLGPERISALRWVLNGKEWKKKSKEGQDAKRMS